MFLFVVAEREKRTSEFLRSWISLRLTAWRMNKKARLDLKGRSSVEVRKVETSDCVEALLKFGLIKADVWHILGLVGKDGEVGPTMEEFMNMFETRTLKSKSVFEDVGKEGESFKSSKGCIHSRKPTKALLKEFMRIIAFLVWNEVGDFASAKEDVIVENYEEMKRGKKEPSDALLTWMSGIRVPQMNGNLAVSVNFPDLSIYLLNQEWGIHDGESLKEKVEVMSEFTDAERLSKWVPVEHVVAVSKATLDLKGTSIPKCEVDLLFHSPGEVQRKELVHLLKVKGLTDEEIDRMMWRDALFGDCSYAVFVNCCTGCFERMIGCPIEEKKMMALTRACVFMEKGMEGVLKVDRILRFAHSSEFQRMAERCQLPKCK